MIRGHVAECIARGRPLARAIHRHLQNRVANLGSDHEGRAAAVGHTHIAGRAERTADSGGGRDHAGRGDAELAGQVAFEGLAFRITQGDVIDEKIADIAIERGPSVGVVAADVDVGGIGSRHSRHQRGHRAGGSGRVNLRAVGEDLELTIRLAHQAEHRHLAVGNGRGGVELHPVAPDREPAGVVEDT